MFKFVVILTIVAFAIAHPTKILQDPRIDVNTNWRVVGGTDAEAGAFPFIVSLRTTSNNLFCGGSIINNEWILTAAHCIVGVGGNPAEVMVVAGTNTLNAGGVTHPASRFIVHGDFEYETLFNDVAVIQLAIPLSYTSVIGPVALNTADTGAVTATLIGWGLTSTEGYIPNNLQQLNTNTITHALCQSTWGSLVITSQICAFSAFGQGACFGDSGGPLVQAGSNVQLGIVSFGVACAQGFPDVYTRVSSFDSWITSSIA
uniref:Serine protease 8 n=1 Tax=Costelytra zealandica TaxID=50579 RepID=B0ZBN6_9SCAR|nr:serine protease 8 [Costelytra zealandica]